MNEDEKRSARYFIGSIEDNMLSIKNEIYNVGEPFKPYLLEKLEKIRQDVACLTSMCEEE